MKYRIVAITGIVTLLMTGSCREEHRGTIIARVADAELTLEEANEHIDTTQGPRDRQLAAYVTSWIDAELIHQEAKLTKIDQSAALDRRLRDLKRQFVNQEYLDRYLYADSAVITEQSVREYYDAHHSEFFAREDLVMLRLAVLGSREMASTFISRLVRNADWDAAVGDSALRSSIIALPPPKYYSRHTLFPPELWKIAMTLDANETSFPVKIAAGYAVLQPLSIVREGKPAPFDLAWEEVGQRMIVENRRKKYEELLGTLRKRYRVELFTGAIRQSDTLRSDTHE